jgi:hypothetical protein
MDGPHMTETMSYLVVNRGMHTLSDGTMIEADSFKGLKDTFTFVPFASSFTTIPVVLP